MNPASVPLKSRARIFLFGSCPNITLQKERDRYSREEPRLVFVFRSMMRGGRWSKSLAGRLRSHSEGPAAKASMVVNEDCGPSDYEVQNPFLLGHFW
jgi:hypothetical protein